MPPNKQPSIIHNADEITPEWLTDVLAFSGTGGKVESFTAESIGTGQVGENVRFTLQGNNVPATIVGKFPSTDPVSKQTGINLNNYVREVFFYKEIQPTVEIQTPRVFFTDIDTSTHDFVLMMEDLAPGVQGDQMAGCSVDEAAIALEQLAKLQAPRWQDPTLANYPLLTGTSSEPSGMQMFYKSLEPGFVARYQSRLNEEQLKVVSETGDALATYNEIYNAPPCLVHVDYRLDNMMFGGPYPLAVVDWQSISTGCPVADVSYFLGTSLATEDRRAEERALLRHYLSVLKSYDIDMSEDDCLAYYQNYAPAGLIMAVIASMIVGETARGNDMFMAMATRSAQLRIDFT